jgi:hypothetical protein
LVEKNITITLKLVPSKHITILVKSTWVNKTFIETVKYREM